MDANHSLDERELRYEPTFLKDLRWGFFVWELLRVPYNLALGIMTIIAAGVFREHFQVGIPGGSGIELVIAAVAANVLYTVGSAAELYLYILGLRDRGWRNIIRVIAFTMGTIASVAAAYLCTMILLMETAKIDLDRLPEVMPERLFGNWLPDQK